MNSDTSVKIVDRFRWDWHISIHITIAKTTYFTKLLIRRFVKEERYERETLEIDSTKYVERMLIMR